MKTQFNTVHEFVSEINRREAAKNDYVIPNNQMTMEDDGKTLRIPSGAFIGNQVFHGQIASKLGIPKKYYDDMDQVPGLRAMNVNAWMKHEPDERRMVRTLDGTARAFLSDRFRPIDNSLILQSFLPVLQEIGGVQVHSNILSDTRMYLQVSTPKVVAEVKKGDVVQGGIILTNSEVGFGAVDVKSLVWRLVCGNGMIGESVLRRYHVGKRIDEETADIYRDDTIRAEIDSFRLRLRDVVTHALSQTVLDQRVEKMREAMGDKIEKVVAVVENVTKRFQIPLSLSESIIDNMATEGNMNRYGLANAITYQAHHILDADKAYEIEKIGNEIINLTPGMWSSLAYVA